MASTASATEELSCARQELDNMHQNGDEKQKQRHWRNFLNHLDKAWVKLVIGCGDMEGKFQRIKSQVKEKQKKDPLLIYLAQARDADNHSVQNLAGFQFSHELPIDQASITMSVIREGVEISKTEAMPMNLYTFQAVPFTNRGKQYSVPQYHIGLRIVDHLNPFVLGTIGIDYYTNQIARTRELLQID